MIRVVQGGTAALTVTWAADAADTSLTVYTPAGLVLAGFPVVIGLGAITKTSTGVYAYSWVTGGALAAGEYVAQWTATVSAAATTHVEAVEVVDSSSTVAYATAADFADTFESPPAAARAGRIAAVLAEASALIDAELGFDHYRHPVGAGTEARIFDGPRTRRRLCVHAGIVSVTTVEVRYVASDTTWTTLAATDWYLEPRVLGPDESYQHLCLTGSGTWPAFPWGVATIRITGVFGYAAVPTMVRRATVALARQIYRADATTPGGMVGDSELSMGAMPRGWPDDTWRLVRYVRARDFCYAG